MNEQNPSDNPEQSPEPAPAAGNSLVLDLSFGPSWAKKAPARSPWEGKDAPEERVRGGSGRSGALDRDRPGRGRPKERRGGDRRKPGSRRGDAESAPVAPRPEAAALPPLDVRFFPSQKHLSSVVRQIHSSKKAYPFKKLAMLFLTNPEYCFAKIQPAGEGGDLSLFQCGKCAAIALGRQSAVAHLLKAHTDDFFDKEEKICDPPSGQFVCVARCERSGILLGPPNHHSYADKVEEVRRSRFPAMTAEEYRSGIKVLRDPALIEQWKEESRKRTLYRPKGGTGEALSLSEVEEYVEKNLAGEHIEVVKRAALPMSVVTGLAEPAMSRFLSEAWNREKRFPRSMLQALHMALRRMRLHVSRSGRGREFVSAIKPVPLDRTHVAEEVRRLLTYIEEHNDATRAGVQEAFRGEASAGSEQSEISSISWLVEEGHIVEWHDGVLWVVPEPPAKQAAMPAAVPAAAVAKDSSVPASS